MGAILAMAVAFGVSESLIARASLDEHDEDLLNEIMRELGRLGAWDAAEYPEAALRLAPILFSAPYTWELQPNMRSNVYIGPMWRNEQGGISSSPGSIYDHLVLWVSPKGRTTLKGDLVVYVHDPNAASLEALRDELMGRADELREAFIDADADRLEQIGYDEAYRSEIPMWATDTEARDIIENDPDFRIFVEDAADSASYALVNEGEGDLGVWTSQDLNSAGMAEDWNETDRELWLTVQQIERTARGLFEMWMEDYYLNAVSAGEIEGEEEDEDW